MKLLHCYTITTALAALIVTAGCAQQKGSQANTITKEQVQSCISELQPVIEEIAGRKFKKVPEVEVKDLNELIKPAIDRMSAEARKIDPKMSETELHKCSELTIRFGYSKTSTDYSPNATKFHFMPDQFRMISKASGITSEESEKFAKLALSYELAFALYDQNVDEKEILKKSKSNDQISTAGAVRRGFVTYISDNVAKQLGLEGVKQKYLKFVMTPDPNPDNPKPSRSEAEEYKSYFQLRNRIPGDFVAWQYRKLGKDKVWEVLSNPPAASKMLLHPETYSTTLPASEDYGKVLSGIEKMFGNRPWKVEMSEEGAIQARQTVRDRVRNDVAASHIITAVLKDKKSTAIVDAYVLGSSADAKKLCDLQFSTFAPFCNMKSASGYHSIPSDASVQWKGGNVTQWVWFYPHTFNCGSKPEPKGVTVVRGHVMVDIFTVNLTLSDKTTAAIFEQVFSRMPK